MKKNKSKIFNDSYTKKRGNKREVFVDGHWTSLNDTLTLTGWDSMQRDCIHHSLKAGMSINTAVEIQAKRIGYCPIKSKMLFK